MEKIITYSVDTETTGLKSETDEILQLSIVDENGVEIFNEYFCPSYYLSWDEAEKVNHITPEMVAGKPTIRERLADINAIFARCNVIVGYNTGFDLSFLKAAGIEIPENIRVIDVQQMYMGVVADRGEWDWERNRPKWRSLKECAEFCYYEWQGEAHDSLEDARAAMACYIRLSIFMDGSNKMVRDEGSSYLKPLKHCPFCRTPLENSLYALFCPLCGVHFRYKKEYWECGFKIKKALASIPEYYEKFRILSKKLDIEDGIMAIRKKAAMSLSDCDTLVSIEEEDDLSEMQGDIPIWGRTIKFRFKPREEFEEKNGQD